jgi:hypothetical protein
MLVSNPAREACICEMMTAVVRSLKKFSSMDLRPPLNPVSAAAMMLLARSH